MRKIILTALFVSVLASPASAVNTRYGTGYTIIDWANNLDTSINQTVRLKCKSKLKDVRALLNHVLTNTGYKLAPLLESDGRILSLYKQPAPTCHKDNEGIHLLSDLLKAIGGRGWTLMEDPVRRFVSYKVNTVFLKQTFVAVPEKSFTPGDKKDKTPDTDQSKPKSIAETESQVQRKVVKRKNRWTFKKFWKHRPNTVYDHAGKGEGGGGE